MSNVKTITLTGNEAEINFDRSYAYVECNNLGGSEILMSLKPNIERGNDDVIIIKSGMTASMGDIGVPAIKTVYLSGNGEVQIVGKSFPQNSFKSVPKGGGGEGGVTDYTDLTSLPSINSVTLIGNKTSEDLGLSGGGTDDYNDLTNKPTFEGKTIEGELTLEDFGFKRLAKDGVYNIFDRAVYNVNSKDIIAKIPFNGYFDGYGYSYYVKGNNYSMTENGIYLNENKRAEIQITVPELNTFNKIEIKFDIFIDSITNYAAIFNFIRDSYGLYLQVYDDDSYEVFFYALNIKSEKIQGNGIKKWDHISLTYDKANKVVTFSVNGKETQITDIYGQIYNYFHIGNDLTYNVEYYLKNLKVYRYKDDIKEANS